MNQTSECNCTYLAKKTIALNNLMYIWVKKYNFFFSAAGFVHWQFAVKFLLDPRSKIKEGQVPPKTQKRLFLTFGAKAFARRRDALGSDSFSKKNIIKFHLHVSEKYFREGEKILKSIWRNKNSSLRITLPPFWAYYNFWWNFDNFSVKIYTVYSYSSFYLAIYCLFNVINLFYKCSFIHIFDIKSHFLCLWSPLLRLSIKLCALHNEFCTVHVQYKKEDSCTMNRVSYSPPILSLKMGREGAPPPPLMLSYANPLFRPPNKREPLGGSQWEGSLTHVCEWRGRGVVLWI